MEVNLWRRILAGNQRWPVAAERWKRMEDDRCLAFKGRGQSVWACQRLCEVGHVDMRTSRRDKHRERLRWPPVNRERGEERDGSRLLFTN